jgi:hypothetical protein
LGSCNRVGRLSTAEAGARSVNQLVDINNQLLFPRFLIVVFATLDRVSVRGVIRFGTGVAVSARTVYAGARAIRAAQRALPLAESSGGYHVYTRFEVDRFRSVVKAIV